MQPETRIPDFHLPVINIPAAVVVVDQAGVVLDLNDHFSSRLGYSKGDLRGRSISVVVPREFRSRHDAYVQSYFRDPTTRSMGSAQSKVAVVHSDGRVLRAEIALVPCEEEDCAAAVISVLGKHDPARYQWIRSVVLSVLLLILGIALDVCAFYNPEITSLPDGSLLIGVGIGALLHVVREQTQLSQTQRTGVF